MFYCTNVQFYRSIFNVSLNLFTSVQKYMYIPDCFTMCTTVQSFHIAIVYQYDHLFLLLLVYSSVHNYVPVYEIQMCTSVQFCKHKDKCTSVH